MAIALLVVLTEPIPGREDQYNDWYTNRHLGDVLAAAGFTAAQRFHFVPSKLSRNPPPAPYLAIYEVDADRREEAEEFLLAAVRTEAMPISAALGPGAVTWWFESMCDRVEDGEQAGASTSRRSEAGT
ncbi:hypothetical protein [Sporichthya polymorpha]|uniref:hypothetical protein n=1 Tax=Sporichthya polymorpha TaxID=35751 RepID=UPI00038263E4|nr:hypothetical protein [Sporichthya polymorpha]